MTQHMEAFTYQTPDTALTADQLREWAKKETSRVQRELDKIGNCQHCMNFRRADDYCDRWGAQVPAEHQASGCADWCIDLIPFSGEVA